MGDYSIRVLGRGEEIEYREGDASYIFEVCFGQIPYRLYAYQFWSNPGAVGPQRLPDDMRYVVERIAKWMSSDGNPTALKWEHEVQHVPLKSVDELLAERLARRRKIR